MNGFELILPFLRPIQHLILDPDISEIMVNGPERIFIEKAGYLQAVPGVTLTHESLMVAVKNIARRLGDDISEAKPILDSRLPDGNRVAAVLPPCSIHSLALTIRDLMKATLRCRLDRITMGQIRGGVSFDLLQLLNTGHSGTITTVHANSAAQGILRFTTCVLQRGVEMPYRAIKTNITESLNIIVQIDRRPGKRIVSGVLEIRGYNPDTDRSEF